MFQLHSFPWCYGWIVSINDVDNSDAPIPLQHWLNSFVLTVWPFIIGISIDALIALLDWLCDCNTDCSTTHTMVEMCRLFNALKCIDFTYTMFEMLAIFNAVNHYDAPIALLNFFKFVRSVFWQMDFDEINDLPQFFLTL